MTKEEIDLEEDRLLEDRDIEYSMWIPNWPAYRAYNAYVAEKKSREKGS